MHLHVILARCICYSYIHDLTFSVQNKGRATGFFGLDSQNQKCFLITNDHVFAGDPPSSPSSITITFQHRDVQLTGDQLFIDWMSKDGLFRRNQVCFVMLQ